MTPKEELRLRELYATWPAERLAHAVHFERSDYTVEAIGYMIEELTKRGVQEGSLAEIAQLVPSQPRRDETPHRDTVFRPRCLGRKQYLIRWLIWLGVFLALGVVSAVLPAPWSEVLFGCALITVVYRIAGMDIPRLRSIGWSPWAILVLLIPGLNLLLMGFLFFAPPEK